MPRKPKNVHWERPLTSETAKLLGIPFATSASEDAYKLTRVDDGYKIECRDLAGKSPWYEHDNSPMKVETIDECLKSAEGLYLVTFKDEEH